MYFNISFTFVPVKCWNTITKHHAGETHSTEVHYELSMRRTSIPVDSTTKEWLDQLKRDGETWDEFFIRVAGTEEPIEAGAWSDEQAERVKESIRNSRRDW